MGFGVWGLGFGVWGLGFGVWGLQFGFGHLCFGVCESACGAWASDAGILMLIYVLCVAGRTCSTAAASASSEGRALPMKMKNVRDWG